MTQAVLLIPDGLGVIYVDTEDYYTFPAGVDRWAEVRRLFVPIEHCRPLARVQFLPFAADLLARFHRHLHRR